MLNKSSKLKIEDCVTSKGKWKRFRIDLCYFSKKMFNGFWKYIRSDPLSMVIPQLKKK